MTMSNRYYNNLRAALAEDKAMADAYVVRINYENVSDEDWQEWCESDDDADYYSAGADDGIEELVVTAGSFSAARARVNAMLKPGMTIVL